MRQEHVWVSVLFCSTLSRCGFCSRPSSPPVLPASASLSAFRAVQPSWQGFAHRLSLWSPQGVAHSPAVQAPGWPWLGPLLAALLVDVVATSINPAMVAGTRRSLCCEHLVT